MHILLERKDGTAKSSECPIISEDAVDGR